MSDTRPIILDTDIGTDVDDIFALVLLARSPALDLVGVTTVYGDTGLRTRICRYVLDTLGQPSIASVSGERTTLADRELWWAGHEGLGIPGLDDVQIAGDASAPDYLIKEAQRHGGRLEIAAIGPLTNIAVAIQRDPEFGSRIRHLWIMGGAFAIDRAEHNIKCDPDAAQIVFDSGIPITLAPLDVTKRILWSKPERAAIGESNGALGPVLVDQLDRWWAFIGAEENNPHDPIAVLMATHPELYRVEQGTVAVRLDAADAGRTTFTPSADGHVAVATDLDVEAVNAALLVGIGAAQDRSEDDPVKQIAQR